MNSVQEKSNTAVGGQWFISVPPLVLGTPKLVLTHEKFPEPRADRPRGLRAVFGSRKRTRSHNRAIIDTYRNYQNIYPPLRDMDERLEAVDPDYRLNSLNLGFYEGGVATQLNIEISSKRATLQEKEMFDAIIEHAQKEIQNRNGR